MIIIVDRNNVSASSIIEKKNLDIKLLDKLNLNVVELNGHNISKLNRSFKNIFHSKKSSLVIANTIKGKELKNRK